MTDFWMVYREGGGAPTKKHDSYAAAMTEAERLCKLNGGIWHVMRACITCKSVVVWDVKPDKDADPFADEGPNEWVDFSRFAPRSLTEGQSRYQRCFMVRDSSGNEEMAYWSDYYQKFFRGRVGSDDITAAVVEWKDVIE